MVQAFPHLNQQQQSSSEKNIGIHYSSRSPWCVLFALSRNTGGSGDSIYWVVKCLSPYFTQEWAFLTIFFAEYTCHQNKWELEAKNWFIEVKNIPKKRSLLKSFLKGPASNQEFLKCATTNWEFPKCASSNQVTHFRNSWIELAHFGNSQFVVAQFRNSWIELAHFGNSWFEVAHFRNSWFEAGPFMKTF